LISEIFLNIFIDYFTRHFRCQSFFFSDFLCIYDVGSDAAVFFSKPIEHFHAIAAKDYFRLMP